jgi:hypothetical protein
VYGTKIQTQMKMNTTSPPMQTEKKQRNKGVCHTVALPFTFLKNILRQKKNYENSNIFQVCVVAKVALIHYPF